MFHTNTTKEEGGAAWQAREVGGNGLGAVTPGETLGTLYTSGVGTNKTKQHGGLVPDSLLPPPGALPVTPKS